jgi:hypothetical protein
MRLSRACGTQFWRHQDITDRIHEVGSESSRLREINTMRVFMAHAWRFTLTDSVFSLGWGVGVPLALAYLVMTVVFVLG